MNRFDPNSIIRRWEPLLLFLFFIVFAGHLTPAVNEAHYLCKARHYWDPSWSPNDQFMNSADTHLAFYWSFGWITKHFSLPASAWIGRFVLWAVMAFAWTRLSRSLCSMPGVALVSGALATTLCEITNMAGEWFVGGVEGKVLSWALCFLAGGYVIRGKWIPVWPLVGTATAFHPLVGGYSWLIYGVIGLLHYRAASDPGKPSAALVPSLLVGLGAAAIGVVPALLMDWQADPSVTAEAHAIQVHERLPHHLKLAGMKWYRHIRFAALVAAWLLCSCWPSISRELGRLRMMVNGSLVVSGVGALIELLNWITDGALVSMQRYYWFRMSDVWVPIGLTLLITVRVAKLDRKSKARRKAITFALIWLVIWVPSRFVYLRFDRRPHAVRQARPYRMRQSARITARYRDWRELCRWVDHYTPRDATFLTPTSRQTFKWFANRGELATWKGMPQDAAGILEWKQRREEVKQAGLYSADLPTNNSALRRMVQTYGLTHILVEQGWGKPISPMEFPLVYRNSHFSVHRINPGSNGRARKSTFGFISPSPR